MEEPIKPNRNRKAQNDDILKKSQERWNDFRSRFHVDILPILPYHKWVVESLSDAAIEDAPPLLITGSVGFPHSLIWQEVVRRKFELDTIPQHRLMIHNGDPPVPYYEHPYYLLFDLNHPDIGKHLVQLPNMIQNIIRHRAFGNHGRHVIIMEHVEAFRHGCALEAFRVIFERFAKQVWFICTTNSPSSVEGTLRSRLQLVRVPLPTENEISMIADLMEIQNEDINLSRNLIHTIVNCGDKLDIVSTFLSTYRKTSSSNIQCTVPEIRRIASKLSQHGFSLRELILQMLEYLPEGNVRDQFLKEMTNIEHQTHMVRGSVCSMYIEAMFHKFIDIVNTNKLKIK